MVYGMKKGCRCLLSSRRHGGKRTGFAVSARSSCWDFCGPRTSGESGNCSTIRDDAGDADRRENTNCPGPARHSAAELPWIAAPVPNGFLLLPERPIEAKEKLDSAIEQAAGAITEGRDAVQGLRASTVERNDLALAISTLGEELENDSSNHRPATFRVAVEGQRERPPSHPP